MKPDDPYQVGTTLLFENERIRIWSVEVPPGGSWGPHEHPTAYATIVAAGSRVASLLEDGRVELEADVAVDRVDWYDVAARRVHTLENRGSRPYKNFTIELLER